MPWKECRPVRKIRREFVERHQTGLYSVTELCAQYGVSRQTAYKWLRRFRDEGYAGLCDRRRRPHGSPRKTPERLERAILELRDAHPTWGARKLLHVLKRRRPRVGWPSRSTVHDILAREGRVQRRRRRRKHAHPGRPVVAMEEPNAVWTADYKGQFRLGNGRLCYPLTVADGCSRYLLGCRSLTSTKGGEAHRAFRVLFEEYGLPEIILTDNGSPFASTGLYGLTRLSAWWIRLGITPRRTQPSSPQQNGRHERMHRTLKTEATKPPRRSHRAQQCAFDEFRSTFNEERPHQALDMRLPAEVYTPSSRPFPRRLPPLEYSAEAEVRLVSSAGQIRWRGRPISVNQALAGDHVGLLEVGDGLWAVHYGAVEIGRFDERVGRVR